MLKSWHKRLVLAILLIGAVLRLSGLSNISLQGDFKINWEVAERIVSEQELPLLGPQASVDPSLKMGPIFYYFMALFYYLGGGNYQAAIFYFSLLNIFSIWILFKVCQQWFGENLALLASGLYAVSRLAVEFGNYPWNAHFIPLFIIFLLYALTKIPSWSGYLLFGFSLGALVQFHPTVWLILPVFLWAFFFFQKGKELKVKKVLLALGAFLLVVSPYLIGEIKYGLVSSKSAVGVFTPKIEEECNFREWLKHHGHGERCFHYLRNSLFILKLFSYSLFGATNLFVLPLVLLFLIYFILVVKVSLKNFLLLWLIVPIPVFLIYSLNIYLHYFLIYQPLPFIIFLSVLLDLKERLGHNPKLASLVFYTVLTLVLAVNIFANLQVLGGSR